MADDNGKPKLREFLGDALKGGFDPQTGLVGRRHERTQGCWNCKHSDFDKAKAIWKDKRQADLAIAARKALESPMGEQEPAVVSIRRMVDAIDVGLASYNLTTCTGKGVDANENPLGDYVKSNYLCHKWSAAQGASIARAGQKADDLPMELEDKGN
jgi:hypothetical protein